MHGLKGGRWQCGGNGEPETMHPPGKPAGLSPITYHQSIAVSGMRSSVLLVSGTPGRRGRQPVAFADEP
jgi:hypothetical protein